MEQMRKMRVRGVKVETLLHKDSDTGLLAHAMRATSRMTIVTLVHPATGEVFIGTAQCHPDDDNDSLKGLNIAMKRARRRYRDSRAALKRMRASVNVLFGTAPRRLLRGAR
jgi:hypothetical protein